MIGKICTSVLHLTPGSPDTSCLGQAKCRGPSPCLSRRLGIQEQPCKGENCTIRFLNGWNFKNSRKFSFIPAIRDIASSILYLFGCRISWSAVLAALSNNLVTIIHILSSNHLVCVSHFIEELVKVKTILSTEWWHWTIWHVLMRWCKEWMSQRMSQVLMFFGTCHNVIMNISLWHDEMSCQWYSVDHYLFPNQACLRCESVSHPSIVTIIIKFSHTCPFPLSVMSW